MSAPYGDYYDDYDSEPTYTIEDLADMVSDDFAYIVEEFYGGSIEEIVAEYEEDGDDLAKEMADSAHNFAYHSENIDVDFDARTICELEDASFMEMGYRYSCYEEVESCTFDEFRDLVIEYARKKLGSTGKK